MAEESSAGVAPASSPNTGGEGPEARDQKGTGVRDIIASVLGVMIIIAFGFFIYYLLRRLSLGETEWARAMFLFGGVEAVAFAAAGYFFGTQVQRGRVQEAKAEAKAAGQVATAADEAAESERTNTTMLAEGIVAAGGASSTGGLMSSDSTNPALAALTAQAEAVLRARRRGR